MKVTVVIPSFNAEQTIGETLAAVTAQEWNQPWEIVVADNGSTDRTRDVADGFRDRFDRLRIVDASAERGTSFAINSGVAAARGRSVLFCDADDVPCPGWLAAMGNALETSGFVAARMDLCTLNNPLAAQIRCNFQTQEIPRINYPPYLYHVGGGTIGVRRDLFLTVGGYDRSLIYLHDTDFCFKVQLAGEPLCLIKDAVIKIRYRTDLAKTFFQSRKWSAYNILLFKKYRSQGIPRPGGWRRLLKETRAAMRVLAEWHQLSQIDRYQSAWRIGWCVGKWEGIFKFHAPPY